MERTSLPPDVWYTQRAIGEKLNVSIYMQAQKTADRDLTGSLQYYRPVFKWVFNMK